MAIDRFHHPRDQPPGTIASARHGAGQSRLPSALTLALMLAGAALAISACTTGQPPTPAAVRIPQPSVAFYYGPHVPVAALQRFDDVVVEPSSGFAPQRYPATHPVWFAYASMGEILPSRADFPLLPKAWLKGDDPAWSSRLVDQSAPGWPAFYLDHVITPLWNKGYRGFFLDTLDAYQRFAKTDAERAAQQAGIVRTVRAIKTRYPDARLIFNRGFEILPQVPGLVEVDAFESLFRQWNPATKTYRAVSQADRDWLLAQARTVATRDHLPVVVIDYCAPADADCARDTAANIHAVGMTPFITNGAVDSIESAP
ncbi:MAG: endo alpha-1,4 polygalactosaminidase [Janthinobacterium lividum]